MEYLVLRTISLVHINYGLIESLIEITYLYDHQNRIQYINIKLIICGFTHHIFYIHQATIIRLPPLQLVRESLTTAKYFPSVCRLCPHTDITTSQHTSWALRTYIKGIIRHSYNTLGLYGDLHKSLYVDHTMRIIPGIRGRLIPHIECREYKINVTHHIQSSHSWHTKEYLNYRFKTSYIFVAYYKYFAKCIYVSKVSSYSIPTI
jgi:hypothetical protein